MVFQICCFGIYGKVEQYGRGYLVQEVNWFNSRYLRKRKQIEGIVNKMEFFKGNVLRFYFYQNLFLKICNNLLNYDNIMY